MEQSGELAHLRDPGSEVQSILLPELSCPFCLPLLLWSDEVGSRWYMHAHLTATSLPVAGQYNLKPRSTGQQSSHIAQSPVINEEMTSCRGGHRQHSSLWSSAAHHVGLFRLFKPFPPTEGIRDSVLVRKGVWTSGSERPFSAFKCCLINWLKGASCVQSFC